MYLDLNGGPKVNDTLRCSTNGFLSFKPARARGCFTHVTNERKEN